MIKKAMILAAGFGKRISPLTLKNPKPLLKIGNETLLSNTLKFLQLFEIKEIVVNVHYLREQIVDYINKNKFDLIINIVEEKHKILISEKRSYHWTKTDSQKDIHGRIIARKVVLGIHNQCFRCPCRSSWIY